MPTPYVSFDGNCKEAFEFYARALGGTIKSVHPFGDSPMAADMPPEARGLLMHASMEIDGRTLMGSDCGPWAPYEGAMRSCALSLHPGSVEQGKAWFDALAEGGKVTMPYAKTFWAEGFGMLTDKFGVNWMVNCEAAKAG